MLDSDFVVGLTVILTPFILVGVFVARRRKSSAAIRHGAAYSSLNANGLPMVGGVDVNGNSFGSIDVHPTNVNGLPMAGGVDVCGNAFGSTGHTF
ncbi:hypothetical protein [Limnohabitans curvus]|uniref:hypothetical protein n=1 Tax=Limnohabitans curvus TaxID=323423 RepID=UPI0011B22A84|nr:hypothetical protein [Limnohabitans curvus]